MAHDIQDFDGAVGAPDADNPDGKLENSNPQGSGTGTRPNFKMLDQMVQFFAKLMREASITPNDLPENETNGYQFFDALESFFLSLETDTRIAASSAIAASSPVNFTQRSSGFATGTTNTGQSLANLSSEYFASVDNSPDEVNVYSYIDHVFTKVHTLSFGGSSIKIASIQKNVIAVYDNTSLKAYEWDGSSLSQKGNTYSPPTAFISMAAFDDKKLFFGTGSNTGGILEFDGADFTEVNSFALGSSNNDIVIGLGGGYMYLGENDSGDWFTGIYEVTSGSITEIHSDGVSQGNGYTEIYGCAVGTNRIFLHAKGNSQDNKLFMKEWDDTGVSSTELLTFVSGSSVKVPWIIAPNVLLTIDRSLNEFSSTNVVHGFEEVPTTFLSR